MFVCAFYFHFFYLINFLPSSLSLSLSLSHFYISNYSASATDVRLFLIIRLTQSAWTYGLERLVSMYENSFSRVLIRTETTVKIVIRSVSDTN